MADRLFKYGLAVIRDGRLLLCRPYAFPDLIMPGGIREGNETAEQGIAREVKEELGTAVRVRPGSLWHVGRFEDAAAGRDDVVVEMDLWAGELEGTPTASSEISELVWWGRHDDAGQLSAIIRNHIAPALVARGLL
jgi:ADP-ribose pyrophosphatase YjhB (NUDIX family)